MLKAAVLFAVFAMTCMLVLYGAVGVEYSETATTPANKYKYNF